MNVAISDKSFDKVDIDEILSAKHLKNEINPEVPLPFSESFIDKALIFF